MLLAGQGQLCAPEESEKLKKERSQKKRRAGKLLRKIYGNANADSEWRWLAFALRFNPGTNVYLCLSLRGWGGGALKSWCFC